MSESLREDSIFAFVSPFVCLTTSAHFLEPFSRIASKHDKVYAQQTNLVLYDNFD